MKNYASKGKRIGLLLAMLFITSWMFAQVTVTGNAVSYTHLTLPTT